MLDPTRVRYRGFSSGLDLYPCHRRSHFVQIFPGRELVDFVEAAHVPIQDMPNVAARRVEKLKCVKHVYVAI